MRCCWRAWPQRAKAEGQLTAIVTADATDAQRLLDEMAFFAPELRCALFPDWETLPYDTFSPHQDLISERLATLWRISQGDADVVVVPATTALYRVAPPSFLAGYTFHFQVRQKLEEARLKAQLTLAGYSHVTQVVSPGEYAVRGGLIDLFPMGSTVPFRVDLFDDEIDSIRTFDPDSQRSLYPVPEVRLLPGREFPMDDDARARFRSRWRELLEGDPTKSRIYKDIGNGVATAGIEYYLPLFFDETATVFDYLGARRHGRAARRPGTGLPALLAGHADRYRLVRGDPDRPALPPETLFLTVEQFYGRANEHRAAGAADRRAADAYYAEFEALPAMAVVRGVDEPLAQFKAHLQASPQRASAAGRKRRPAREPARLPARQPAVATRLRLARRIPGQRRKARHRHRAAGHRLRLARSRASTSSPRPNCSRPARPRAGARSRSRSATSKR